MNKFDETLNEPILYELLEYFVRKQDPELIKCKNDATILSTSGTIKTALRYLNNRYSLPESISQQVSLTLPWKFAVGDHGRLLAILQENVIEIRKDKDEYSSVTGKASVPKDAFLQWRKIVWSPDGTILVLASSNGYTSFYNSLGNNIFNISPKTVSQNPDILEAGDAIASMMFLKPRIKNEKWSYEFVLVTYSGLLKSYYISTNGFTINYEFSFGSFYKNGVNAVVYDETHNLFYVAGNAITQKLTSEAFEAGLTSWRLLNDYPYCKLSFTFEEHAKSTSRFSLWNIIPTLHAQTESRIFKIRISPNNDHLVCLHTEGSISLWGLPNLLFQKKWKLSDQPDFNVPNPLRLTKCRKFPAGLTEFHPLDIGWWSNQAIIITRYSGSTSVCCIKTLKNLLGISPEFLAGQPQISELEPNCGFLCLDCEVFITSKKWSRESNNEGQASDVSSESEKEDDELEPVTLFNYTTHLVQSTLYSITDIEKFQPKRKKSKVLHRTYRILALKSTTPEELYSRKINIEEYEEALGLANTYNLDTDLVYQTRWRKSELSLNAIQEHLSKVTKRSWVLNECITRVPDTIEAARELLNFGLKGANLETLLAISATDDGKFVMGDMIDSYEESDESTACLTQVLKVNQMLEKLDFENLSNAQIDLIKYRRKLLDHLDKLLVYRIILEPPHEYNKDIYEQFRQLSVVENATRFAKDGDCRGLEIMFTYYGEKLMTDWLAIISFFPETLNPLKYQTLLPACDSEGQLLLLYQRELRQKDWSEKTEFNDTCNLENDDYSQFLYDLDPTLSVYRHVQFTQELLRKWYRTRGYQLERNSCMVDNALELIKIGKSHNITGLDDLLLDLETLDDLVYKVYLEDMSLDQLQKLSDLEKVKLLMSTSNEENFVNNIQSLLLSFIKRKHRCLGGNFQKDLLHNYLISLSKHDLKLPLKFFEYLKKPLDMEIIDIIGDVTTLAADCIYACNDSDMIKKAKCILDTIPKHNDIRRNTLLEELEREIDSAKLLNKYGVKRTLNYIRQNKSNPEVVKLLFIQMARSLNTLMPPPDENQWAQLLNEMLGIHGLCFSCIDVEICFEVCVSARLVSGIKSNVQNCSALIETKKTEQSLLKVSYQKAVNLILEASWEYFNSSKSLTDTNMELAKTCLHLIEDDNPKIKEEYELISSLQILNEFNIDILPFQVRLTNDKLTLIDKCLKASDNAYKKQHRLMTLANMLHVEGNNKRLREGKVLELIAKKALEKEDYSTCAIICQQLMENNHIATWKVILDLGYSDHFEEFKIRKKCLWFAMNNGPTDILSKALEQMHLIEIQMLHKDLEIWAPTAEIEDTNDADSEDEFIDAMTTPQVEKKEFVPRVLETSTEIVKSSANMMKESTFGLIKNISDTSFWKARLKFNFDNISTKLECDDDAEEEVNITVQSFPCFYESLHKHSGISRLDTKYFKYEMPNLQNIKLKCCRALLRIAILSESLCYDLEVRDINNLLLECAKHTILEDWLFGMAYLLCINKHYMSEVQNVFMVLPKNELYIQTATYYYSLELHKKLNRDFNNIYLYDPLSLIIEMLTLASTCEKCELQQKLLECQQMILKSKLQNVNLSFSEVTSKQASKISITQGIEEIDNCQSIDSTNVTEKENVQETPTSEDAEWTDEWGDFSEDENIISRTEQFSCISNDKPIIEELDANSTEEDRFNIFQEAYGNIQCKEHYEQIKEVLLKWPKFTKSECTAINVHPVIRMMKIIPIWNEEQSSASSSNVMLQDYKDLIEKLDSIDVLKEFLNEECDSLSLEQSLCIHLCTDDPWLHEQAVKLIKEKHEATSLSTIILELLFQKNLTASFDPNHPIYNEIVQHVLVNQSLQNIEDNTKKLVHKLVEQKHITQALDIITIVEHIPPPFRTFETCLNLLRRT